MLSLAHAGVRRGTCLQRLTKAVPSPQQLMSTGRLCYFMATGTHPPAGLQQAPLQDCVAEEWGLLVSLCLAGNPADRPTVAQLQLYPNSICHQPVKQAPKAVGSPSKASPAVSAQRYSSRHRQGLPFPPISHRQGLPFPPISHRQGLPFPPISHRQGLPVPPVSHRQGLPFPPISHRGVQALEVATSDSAAVVPHMASNPLFAPSSIPSEVTPAEFKASSATPSQTTSLTAAAPKASRHVARPQRASATAAQAPGAFISVPQLVLGVEQWFPEKSISCREHRQGGSSSSHHAAASSQQSNGGFDGETAGSGEALLLLRRAGGKTGAAHSIGSSQAAAGLSPVRNDITGSAQDSLLSCVEPASEASMILRAVASSHQPPASPNRALCDLAGFGDTDSTAASGLLVPGTTGSKPRAVLGYPKTAASVSDTDSVVTTPLLMCTDNGEQEGRQSEAGQHFSPSRFHVSSGPMRSSVARAPPRRDDTALGKGGVTRWIAQAQGKAAHLAAVVNERAAGMAEQTSTLLQQWSDSQLSTKTVAVSHTQ